MEYLEQITILLVQLNFGGMVNIYTIKIKKVIKNREKELIQIVNKAEDLLTLSLLGHWPRGPSS